MEMTKEEIQSEMTSHLAENKYNKLEDSIHAMTSTPVLIGVIGQPGTGKSYFINNMLGLEEGDEGAAKIGDGDTTQERMVYSHPKNRQLELSDLPGVGTPTFKMSDEYLKEMEADKHDFFLVFFPSTITETEQKIIQKLLEWKKKIALVRTKADEMTRRKDKSVQQCIEEKKDNSRKNLREFKFREEFEIFVISNTRPDIGEYDKLFTFIESNLPKMKRDSVVLHVNAKTEDIIAKKEKLLISRAWKVAALMGTVTGMPFPGIDVPINLAFLSSEVGIYLDTFGLNPEILEKFPQSARQQMKTTLAIHERGLKDFVMINIAKAPIVLSTVLLQEAIELLLPIIGSLITGTVAFAYYFNFLKDVIEKLGEDARTLRRHHISTAV